jgi:hypothetical protein
VTLLLLASGAACDDDDGAGREAAEAELRRARLARAQAQREADRQRRRWHDRYRRQIARATGGVVAPPRRRRPCHPWEALRTRVSRPAHAATFAQAVQLVARPLLADTVTAGGRRLQRFHFAVRMHPADEPRLQRPPAQGILELDLRWVPLCPAGPEDTIHSETLRLRLTRRAPDPDDEDKHRKHRKHRNHRNHPQLGGPHRIVPHALSRPARRRGGRRAGRRASRLPPVPVGVPVSLLLDPRRPTLWGTAPPTPRPARRPAAARTARRRAPPRVVERGTPAARRPSAPTDPRRAAPTDPRRAAPTDPRRAAPTDPRRAAPTARRRAADPDGPGAPRAGAPSHREGPRLGRWEITDARFARRPRLKRLAMDTSAFGARLLRLAVVEVACPAAGGTCRFASLTRQFQEVPLPLGRLLRRAAPITQPKQARQLFAILRSLRYPRCGSGRKKAAGSRHVCLQTGGRADGIARTEACAYYRALHGFRTPLRVQAAGGGFDAQQVLRCAGARQRVLRLQARFEKNGDFRLRETDLDAKKAQLLQRLQQLTR